MKKTRKVQRVKTERKKKQTKSYCIAKNELIKTFINDVRKKV